MGKKNPDPKKIRIFPWHRGLGGKAVILWGKTIPDPKKLRDLHLAQGFGWKKSNFRGEKPLILENFGVSTWHRGLDRKGKKNGLGGKAIPDPKKPWNFPMAQGAGWEKSNLRGKNP